MTGTAFGVSEDDVEAVLQEYWMRVIDTRGKSFETMAEELIDEIDQDRVEKAALRAGCDLDDQAKAAFDEIKAILFEQGILEF